MQPTVSSFLTPLALKIAGAVLILSSLIDLVFMLRDENSKLVIFESHNLGGDAGAAFNELSKNTREWFSNYNPHRRD